MSSSSLLRPQNSAPLAETPKLSPIGIPISAVPDGALGSLPEMTENVRALLNVSSKTSSTSAQYTELLQKMSPREVTTVWTKQIESGLGDQSQMLCRWLDRHTREVFGEQVTAQIYKDAFTEANITKLAAASLLHCINKVGYPNQKAFLSALEAVIENPQKQLEEKTTLIDQFLRQDLLFGPAKTDKVVIAAINSNDPKLRAFVFEELKRLMNPAVSADIIEACSKSVDKEGAICANTLISKHLLEFNTSAVKASYPEPKRNLVEVDLSVINTCKRLSESPDHSIAYAATRHLRAFAKLPIGQNENFDERYRGLVETQLRSLATSHPDLHTRFKAANEKCVFDQNPYALVSCINIVVSKYITHIEFPDSEPVNESLLIAARSAFPEICDNPIAKEIMERCIQHPKIEVRDWITPSLPYFGIDGFNAALAFYFVESPKVGVKELDAGSTEVTHYGRIIAAINEASAKIGDQAFPKAQELLKSLYFYDRMLAVMIAPNCPTKCLDLLLVAVKDPEVKIREAAYAAIGELGFSSHPNISDRSLVALVIEKLPNESPSAKLQAVKSLSQGTLTKHLSLTDMIKITLAARENPEIMSGHHYKGINHVNYFKSALIKYAPNSLLRLTLGVLNRFGSANKP